MDDQQLRQSLSQLAPVPPAVLEALTEFARQHPEAAAYLLSQRVTSFHVEPVRVESRNVYDKTFRSPPTENPLPDQARPFVTAPQTEPPEFSTLSTACFLQ